jgi:succinate dehydrogenase / fumarate reductase membrane anchor subunit
LSKMKGNESKKRKNVIAWFFQRLSGVALIFLIAVHIWHLHYANPAVHPEYGDLVERLSTIGWIAFDISLLVLALFHGLNGVRNIVLDYTNKEPIIRRWNICLGTIGVVFSLFGGAAVIKILTMG